jgi:hypothetical protein
MIMSEINKFDTCIHRSAEEIVKVIKRCSCQGGPYEKRGHFCNKKQVFDINKEFCDGCDQYKSK